MDSTRRRGGACCEGVRRPHVWCGGPVAGRVIAVDAAAGAHITLAQVADGSQDLQLMYITFARLMYITFARLRAQIFIIDVCRSCRAHRAVLMRVGKMSAHADVSSGPTSRCFPMVLRR